ncbi:Bpu10I family restriction endonuclease [archaeon]|nr:Bpu10I family restriction endonuclease [archaeon]
MDIELVDVAKTYLAKIKEFLPNDFDVHRDNLIKKLGNTISANKEEKSASFIHKDHMVLFLEPYINYRKNIENIYLTVSDRDLLQDELIDEFIKYKANATKINSETRRNSGDGLYFSAQSKYEPTILEEFIGYFLKPLIKDLAGVKCGPVKAYSEMSIEVKIDNTNVSIDLDQKTKNQDFSIYTENVLKIKNSSQELHLQVPIVSIECKTYIDKTMLEGSLSTAQRIKHGNPKSKFYIVSETYDLSSKEEINPHEIDNIFIIRKSKRKAPEDIDPNVLKDIYTTIENDILNVGLSSKPILNIKSKGKFKI